MELQYVEPFVFDLDHPEGVAYGPDDLLYAGGEEGQIYRIGLKDGSAKLLASTGGFCLGLAIDANSNIYVCDTKNQSVIRITPEGRHETYARGSKRLSMETPNFPVFDADGNLYVSDSGQWGKLNGRIYRIRTDGSAEIWSTEPSDFTNGLALSDDNRYLYVVESIAGRISRIEVRDDGHAGVRETVVEIAGTIPDGLAFDSVGNLYISCYAPDRIYRFAADGSLEIFLDDPQRRILNSPTNICFAGDNLRDLVIASLGGRALCRVSLDICGMALNYPTLQTSN